MLPEHATLDTENHQGSSPGPEPGSRYCQGSSPGPEPGSRYCQGSSPGPSPGSLYIIFTLIIILYTLQEDVQQKCLNYPSFFTSKVTLLKIDTTCFFSGLVNEKYELLIYKNQYYV